MHIHLVRHGEVYNPDHVVYAAIPGFRLSKLGRAQAVAAGERLADRHVIAVVSSPLERARQTAEAIAYRHDVAVRVDERLTEWLLTRRWAGSSWESLDERFPGEVDRYWDSPTDLPFSPESIDEVADRMVAAVLSHASANGDTVFVSHQDPVQAARLALTRRPLTELHTGKPSHASIITLERDDAGWAETAHWEPHQEPLSAAEDRGA